jgi:hypothetical protein
MAKSILDQLREHLEDVENTFLYLLTIMFFFAVIGALTLVGIYFYTRH